MNKTKQNKTKQNSLLCRYGLTSAAALLLTFGGASAVRADDKAKAEVRNQLLEKLGEGLNDIQDKKFPTPTPADNGGSLSPTYVKELLKYLEERDKAENKWRDTLLDGIQRRAFDGQDGKPGPQGEPGLQGKPGPQGEPGPRGE
ncbi:TPA: collagen-like protein, partial [Streptococcus pyogenes]|nr:collagen-like protein [Streptococcus pyogenes]